MKLTGRTTGLIELDSAIDGMLRAGDIVLKKDASGKLRMTLKHKTVDFDVFAEPLQLGAEKVEDYSYWIKQDRYFSCNDVISSEERWDDYTFWMDQDLYFEHNNQITCTEEWSDRDTLMQEDFGNQAVKQLYDCTQFRKIKTHQEGMQKHDDFL